MAGEVGGGLSAAEMGLTPEGAPPEAVEDEEATGSTEGQVSKTEAATNTDSVAVQGREFSRGDRVTIRRGISDGRPRDENDWTIDSISNNGRVVVRRPKKDGIDDVLTFAPDEFVSWQAAAKADPTQPDASDGLTPPDGTVNEPEPADGGVIPPVEPPVRPDATGGGGVPPAPPVPGAPASVEAQRSAEAEQRIRSLDLVIEQYAKGANADAVRAENRYSTELAGRGIRGIFKGFGTRLVAKMVIGGGLGAAFGGVVGAGAGVVGAFGSEAGVLGTRLLRYAGGKLRERISGPDELQRLEQMQAEKQNALAEVARRAMEARAAGDPARADQLRLEFLELSSQMSKPDDPRNQAMAELERSYRGRKKWADLGWGIGEAGMGLAGGLLAGNAFIEKFAAILKAKIEAAGFVMGKGGDGIGVLANHAQGLKEMQAAGHHVHMIAATPDHPAQLVFNYQGGHEAALATQAWHNAVATDPASWAHSLLNQFPDNAGRLAHDASGLAGEFSQQVAKRLAERVTGILVSIGLASLIPHVPGLIYSARNGGLSPSAPKTSLDLLNDNIDLLRGDLQGGGTPPGEDGSDEPGQPDPEKKERIPIGSIWEMRPGGMFEKILETNAEYELPEHCRFKVTNQDDDGRVTVVIDDKDIHGNPVIAKNERTGEEYPLRFDDIPYDDFVAGFMPVAEAVTEPEDEDDGLDWDEVDEILDERGFLPSISNKDIYEIDDPELPGEKKKVTVKIEKGTPRKTETKEDGDSAEEETAEPMFRLTFTDEDGNQVTTDPMITAELNEKFVNQDPDGRTAFISDLFKRQAEKTAEVEEDGGEDEESPVEEAEPEAKPEPVAGSNRPEAGGEEVTSGDRESDSRSETERGEDSPDLEQRARQFVEFLRSAQNLKVTRAIEDGRPVTKWLEPTDAEVIAKKDELELPVVSSVGFTRIPLGVKATLKLQASDNEEIEFDYGIPQIDFDVESFDAFENPRLERAGVFLNDEYDQSKFTQAIESNRFRVFVRDTNNMLYAVRKNKNGSGCKTVEVDSDNLSVKNGGEVRAYSSIENLANQDRFSDWYTMKSEGNRDDGAVEPVDTGDGGREEADRTGEEEPPIPTDVPADNPGSGGTLEERLPIDEPDAEPDAADEATLAEAPDEKVAVDTARDFELHDGGSVTIHLDTERQVELVPRKDTVTLFTQRNGKKVKHTGTVQNIEVQRSAKTNPTFTIELNRGDPFKITLAELKRDLSLDINKGLVSQTGEPVEPAAEATPDQALQQPEPAPKPGPASPVVLEPAPPAVEAEPSTAEEARSRGYEQIPGGGGFKIFLDGGRERDLKPNESFRMIPDMDYQTTISEITVDQTGDEPAFVITDTDGDRYPEPIKLSVLQKILSAPENNPPAGG